MSSGISGDIDTKLLPHHGIYDESGIDREKLHKMMSNPHGETDGYVGDLTHSVCPMHYSI